MAALLSLFIEHTAFYSYFDVIHTRVLLVSTMICVENILYYQVSDQKPLGSWTVKQGQTITSPVVFNTQNQEYVVVTDDKVKMKIVK